MKEVIIKKEKGNYKIPRFLKLNLSKKIYKFEYNGKLYNKELKIDNKNIYQLSLLVEALNIKNKRQRYEFIYNKACDLLDSDFLWKMSVNLKMANVLKIENVMKWVMDVVAVSIIKQFVNILLIKDVV